MKVQAPRGYLSHWYAAGLHWCAQRTSRDGGFGLNLLLAFHIPSFRPFRPDQTANRSSMDMLSWLCFEAQFKPDLAMIIDQRVPGFDTCILIPGE
jgi:hypothetical protein